MATFDHVFNAVEIGSIGEMSLDEAKDIALVKARAYLQEALCDISVGVTAKDEAYVNEAMDWIGNALMGQAKKRRTQNG